MGLGCCGLVFEMEVQPSYSTYVSRDRYLVEVASGKWQHAVAGGGGQSVAV